MTYCIRYILHENHCVYIFLETIINEGRTVENPYKSLQYKWLYLCISSHWTVIRDFERGNFAEVIYKKKSSQSDLEKLVKGCSFIWKNAPPQKALKHSSHWNHRLVCWSIFLKRQHTFWGYFKLFGLDLFLQLHQQSCLFQRNNAVSIKRIRFNVCLVLLL